MPLRSWFKGADTTSLLIFLEDKLKGAYPNVVEERPYYQDMLLAVCSANAFLKTLYHGGLWLSATESSYVIAEGQKCLKHFQRCAERAFHLGFTRWKLQPKFHMLGEVLFEMGTLRMAGKPVPNPLTYSCQMDEDLVGRVSAFSRVVSSRTIHERTLSRYQVALAGKW